MKIHMTGGSPWGFKMKGGKDFRQPLAIGKVTVGGKADRGGVVEGHHILSVNGEDVRDLPHLEAQNKIKAAKSTLVLELTNAPVPSPSAIPDKTPTYTNPAASSYAPANKSYAPTNKPASTYNTSYGSTPKPASTYNSTSKAYAPSHTKSVSLPSKMSAPRSPSTYSSPHSKASSFEEARNGPPDVEYRPVDSRDSQRRMYEDTEGSDWAPNAYQSTLQSPSMQALVRSSGNTTSVSDSEKPTLQITAEIKDMILEEEGSQQNGHRSTEGSLRPTGMKVYNPEQYSRAPTHPSPASYSAPSNPSYAPPPSNYVSPAQPTNTRSQAVGNISKFLQTSGAKQGKPVFAKSLQDLQCPYGDPAVLEIRIGNALPAPTVNWYHNERPIRESKEKDIKFLGKGIVHTLVLGEFAPEFEGRYRCTLTNKHGSTSCSSTLSLEQIPNNSGYVAAPTMYNSGSYQPQSYQPQSTYQPSSYQQPSSTYQPRKPVASNSVGLYSRNTVNETYAAQTGKRPSREEPEESEVMRALREEGEREARSQTKSRSMRMLEETLMPESEDL